MHTRRGSGAALRGRPRKQRAPLRAARRRRGRAGPAPGAEDPARAARRGRRGRRAGKDRAEQAGAGLLEAGQNRAYYPTGIRDSHGPSFGPASAWMDLSGQLGTASYERKIHVNSLPGTIFCQYTCAPRSVFLLHLNCVCKKNSQAPTPDSSSAWHKAWRCCSVVLFTSTYCSAFVKDRFY